MENNMKNSFSKEKSDKKSSNQDFEKILVIILKIIESLR